MSEAEVGNLRVLVVDDSPYNRRVLTSVLEGISGVEVIGRAKHGREALSMVAQLQPDFVTLDLEMPEMDGFMFLRLATRRYAMPVLVVSGYSSRDNVFRALELGAMDFISTPSDSIAPDLRVIARELEEKVELVKRLARSRKMRRLVKPVAATPIMRQSQSAASNGRPPVGVVAIASSTGGPLALQTLLSRLDATLPISVVIAQHMPAQYTQTFAARLNQQLALRVREAQCGDRLGSGTVYFAPGGRHMVVENDEQGAVIRILDAGDPSVTASHVCPNADRLLTSVGQVFRARSCAVVLTGMGDDGARGCRAIKGYGGHVIAQDPDTAVVPGMPRAAIDSGVTDQVAPLADIHDKIESFVETLGANLCINAS